MPVLWLNPQAFDGHQVSLQGPGRVRGVVLEFPVVVWPVVSAELCGDLAPVGSGAAGDQPPEVGLQVGPAEGVDDHVVAAVDGPFAAGPLVQSSGCADFELEGFFSLLARRPGVVRHWT